MGAGAYWGVQAMPDSDVITFEDQYTGTGKCLEKSPYNPDNGAFVDVRKIGGEKIIAVTPVAANAEKLSVLFLTVNKGGGFSPGDHNSAAFLMDSNCIPRSGS